MTTSSIIHKAAGSPDYPRSQTGRCRVCGLDGAGVPFDKWVRDTFTDHDKLLAGTILCDACQFCFEESSELLRQRVGKDKPQRMRNYSHFVLNGEWIPLSKGDKARMVSILRQSPDVAIIAVSGQKHIIFRAQPGWWQIEEKGALPFGAQLWDLLDTVEALYTVFSKDEIETGRYDQRRIMLFGIVPFLQLESIVKPARGSLPLELALFLAQKKEEDNGGLSEGVPPSTETADSTLAQPGTGVQAEVRAEHLGTVSAPDPKRSVHREPEPVLQLSLF